MICQLVKAAHTKLSSLSFLQHRGRLVRVAWNLDSGIFTNQCLREGSSVSDVGSLVMELFRVLLRGYCRASSGEMDVGSKYHSLLFGGSGCVRLVQFFAFV